MSTKTNEWLLNYCRSRHIGDGLTDSELQNKDLFKNELLDSLQVVELVQAMELQFQIGLENSHFNEPRFSTLTGMAQIIDQLVDKRAKSA